MRQAEVVLGIVEPRDAQPITPIPYLACSGFQHGLRQQSLLVGASAVETAGVPGATTSCAGEPVASAKGEPAARPYVPAAQEPATAEALLFDLVQNGIDADAPGALNRAAGVATGFQRDDLGTAQ